MPIARILSNASVAGIRAPSADTGRAQAFSTFSQVYARMSDSADHFATKYLNEKNEKAALSAVERGDFKPAEEKGRAAFELYNKVGLAAQASKIDTEIQMGIKDIAARNPRNLEQFTKEANDLRGKVMEGLDVRLRQPAQLKFDAVQGAAYNGISQTLYKEAREMDAANLSFSAQHDMEDAKRLAYSGDVAGAARVFDAANKKRSGLVAFGRKPEALLKLSDTDREEIVMATYMGELDRSVALSPEKAFNLIGEVRAAGLNEKNDELTVENRAKLVQRMESRIKDINAQADRNQKLYDKQLADRQEMNMARLVPQAIEGELTDTDLAEMRDRREISGSDYVTLYKINDKGQEPSDDAEAINGVYIDAALGEEKGNSFIKLIQLSEGKQITPSTFASVWSRINDESMTDIHSMPSYKAAAQELKTLFKPEGMFGAFREGMNEKLVDALRDLEDAAAQGKPLREVVDRWKPIALGTNQTPIVAMPPWVILGPNGKPDYARTKDRLDTELDSGVMGDSAYDRRMKQLEELVAQ